MAKVKTYIYLNTAHGGYKPVTAVDHKQQTVFTQDNEPARAFTLREARTIVEGLKRNGKDAFLIQR